MIKIPKGGHTYEWKFFFIKPTTFLFLRDSHLGYLFLFVIKQFLKNKAACNKDYIVLFGY